MWPTPPCPFLKHIHLPLMSRHQPAQFSMYKETTYTHQSAHKKKKNSEHFRFIETLASEHTATSPLFNLITQSKTYFINSLKFRMFFFLYKKSCANPAKNADVENIYVHIHTQTHLSCSRSCFCLIVLFCIFESWLDFVSGPGLHSLLLTISCK